MKKRIYAFLFAAFLLASCGERIPAENGETTPPAFVPEATVPVTEETHVVIQPAVPQEPVTVIANPGGVQVHTVMLQSEDFRSFRWGEKYTILVTFDLLRDKDGNIWKENGVQQRTNFRVHLLDNDSGHVLDEQPLPDASNTPEHLAYTMEGECVLYREENGAVTQSWSFDVTDGKMQLKCIPPRDSLTLTYQFAVSPDGKWTAYRVTTDDHNNGGILLRSESGAETMICENVMLDKDGSGDIAAVTGYSVLGFLDSEHLVYNVMGWEWVKGYGICNVTTGEKTEFLDGHRAEAICDGVIYGMDSGYGGMDAAYILGTDGTASALTPAAGYEKLLFGTEQFTWGFGGGRWMLVPYSETGTLNRVYVFSADLKTLEAEIAVTDGTKFRGVVMGDGTVTVVLAG